jgi:hypothetical protein
VGLEILDEAGPAPAPVSGGNGSGAGAGVAADALAELARFAEAQGEARVAAALRRAQGAREREGR